MAIGGTADKIELAAWLRGEMSKWIAVTTIHWPNTRAHRVAVE
jgi:hypothetical protein